MGRFKKLFGCFALSCFIAWLSLAGAASATIAGYLDLDEAAAIAPLLTTAGNPSDYGVGPGEGYDGVAKLVVSFGSGSYGGSGVLLKGGQYLLTAAHMVDNSTGLASAFAATFSTPAGGITTTAAQYYLPSSWTGDYRDGSDIALVRLSSPVTAVQGYELYRGDALGEIGDLLGYGRGGTGLTGYTSSFGTLREGENRYETYWGMTGLPYAYDFDSGSLLNNALSTLGFSSDLGLGDREVLAVPGDSGGPTLVDGKVAGIHSFYASFGTAYGDLDPLLNGTFGELGGDTRVSWFADWINATAYTPVPVPGALFLLGPALALLACFKRGMASC